MGKTAFILMIITIFSKVLGFAREMILSFYYGASNISDAYLVSLTIPNVIFSFVGASLYTGYVPIYSQVRQDYGQDEANKYTNNLINVLIIACTIIIIFGYLFTEPLVKLFASGFTGDTLNLAIKFTRYAILGIYFSGLLYVYSGFIRLQDNFIIPELPVFLFNIIIIASILLSSKIGIMTLPIGALIATASQLIIVFPYALKKGLKYRPTLDIRDDNLRQMIIMVLPVILGQSVDQINVLIDRTLASSISVGGISALNYASRLNGSVFAIFVNTISTIIYPLISRKAAENNIDGLKKSVHEAISMISLLLIPASFGTAIFAEPIVKLLFGRGAFDSQATQMTSAALLCYSFGTLAFGLRNILSKTFYSLKDTRTPMINATISVAVNVIVSIVLSRYIGIAGLALGTSMAAIFCTILLAFNLRKKIGALGIRHTFKTCAKIVAASLIMGIISKIAFNEIQKYLSSNVSLLCSIALAVLIYFIAIYFMKVDEINSIIGLFRKMLKRDNTH